MSKCNKLNCPMQYNKVADDCDIKDCPYRTEDKIEDWETASKFLAMIFGLSEEQQKENVEKVKRDYNIIKEIEKEEDAKQMKEQIEKREIAEMANVTMERCEIDNQCGSCNWSTCNECLAEVLYNAGYRKQINAVWLERHCEFTDGSQMVEDYYCSNCFYEEGDNDKKFCPNCGAHMRGVRNENNICKCSVER